MYVNNIQEHTKKLFNPMINMFMTGGCYAFFLSNGITLQLLLQVFIMFSTLHFVIFMHELGHYYFGKKYGLHIESFTVGIGSTLFSLKHQETKFSFNLVPFLGFVKPAHKEEFENLKGRQRILFALGGVFINFLFYLIGMIMLGLEKGYSVLYGLERAFMVIVTFFDFFIRSFEIQWLYTPNGSFDGQVQGMLDMSNMFSNFWFGFTLLNLSFFVFNLFPIPPLDGSHIFRECIVKTMKLFRIPKRFISYITGGFLVLGALFFGSRTLINNAWDIYNDIRDRWLEFSLWFLLFISVIGYFTQRKLEKSTE